MSNFFQKKYYGFFILSFIILIWFITALLTLPQAPRCDDPNDPIINKPGKTTVHIFAHSHDDVGWIHTLQRYYNDSVKSIIDNVVEELGKN